MRKFCTICAFLSITLLFTSPVNAAYNWYYGKITRIWTTGNYMIVTLDTDQLDDCKYRYAYFGKPDEMSKSSLESAYIMALSAFYTGQKVGIVIDKDKNINDRCYARSIEIRK